MPSGNFIQLLSVLSEMQGQRRQLELQRQQFEEQKHQFAVGMGFQEKSAEYKKITDLLENLTASSHESRGSLIELGQSLHLDPASIQALSHYGQNAPESLAMLRTQAAQQGVNAMTPEQRGAMNNEAALAATTGMNQGTMANSGMAAMLAQGTQGMFQGMNPAQQGAYLRDFLQRNVNGQDVGAAAVSHETASQPGLAAFAAKAGAGQIMTAAQGAQADIGRGGVQADFYRTNAQMIANANDVSAKLATAKAMGGLTPENIIQGVNGMREIVVAAGKEKNEANRMKLAATWNTLARVIDPRLSVSSPDEIFQKAGILDKIGSSFSPPGLPAFIPPPGQVNPMGAGIGAPPVTNPMQPNPMQPWFKP